MLLITLILIALNQKLISMKHIIVLLTALLICSCSDNQKDSKQPIIDSEEISKLDPCSQLDVYDRQMLDLYEEVMVKYKDDFDFINWFKQSQIYWVQYKDRHVKSLYPDKNDSYKRKYGMQANYCKCEEWTRMTKRRIEDIEVFLGKGSDRYKDCPTVIKF